VTQQARQLAWTFPERRPDSVSHPRSRQQFRPSFDAIVLPPAFGAVLMSLSTVIVAINAQLLRRVNL